MPHIECSLPKSGNQFELVAGNHLPIIHFKGIGYCLYNSSLTPTSIDLSIT